MVHNALDTNSHRCRLPSHHPLYLLNQAWPLWVMMCNGRQIMSEQDMRSCTTIENQTSPAFARVVYIRYGMEVFGFKCTHSPSVRTVVIPHGTVRRDESCSVVIPTEVNYRLQLPGTIAVSQWLHEPSFNVNVGRNLPRNLHRQKGRNGLTCDLPC